MAMPIYMNIVGKVQDRIEGGCTREGHIGEIDVEAIDHTIAMPFDESKGHHLSRRVHYPIKIMKTVDKSSPKLYKAMCSHEMLTVELVWLRQEEATGGQEEHYFTTTLEDATITSMRVEMPNQYYEKNKMVPHMEEICFAYKGILWNYVPDAIESEDHHDK